MAEKTKKLVKVRRHPFVIQDRKTKHFVESLTFTIKGVEVKYTEDPEKAARGAHWVCDKVCLLIPDTKSTPIQIREQL